LELLKFVFARDYELLTKGGLGALEYVRFQRYTLLFTVMVCTMSLCVILPINLAGHLFTDSMGQMSLANIEPRREIHKFRINQNRRNPHQTLSINWQNFFLIDLIKKIILSYQSKEL
jgi:Late exocytosis, associated with Golgi transport